MVRFVFALLACLGIAQSARADKELLSTPAVDSVEPDISPRVVLSLDTLVYPFYLMWEDKREVNYRKKSYMFDDDNPSQ